MPSSRRRTAARARRELADGDALVARLAEEPPARARRASRRSSCASAFGEPKRLLAPPTSRTPVSARRATAPCRRYRPSRTKPQSVTPRSRGELDREARRRTDGDEQRATGDGRLLHELERQPAADAEDRSLERKQPVAERPADHLVERVVPADVLAQAEQLAVARRRARSRGGRRSPRTQPAPRAAGRAATATSAAETRSSLSTRGASTATASSAPLPQTPHEDDRVEAPLQPRRVEARRVDARPCSRRGRRAARAPAAEALGEAKPSASSSSWPGVRIVTATGRPLMRISSGSSTATTSCARPPGRARRRPWWSSTAAPSPPKYPSGRARGGAVVEEILVELAIGLDRARHVAEIEGVSRLDLVLDLARGDVRARDLRLLQLLPRARRARSRAPPSSP